MSKLSKEIVNSEINLNSSVGLLKGIGPHYERLLKASGIKTVRDLIWLFPKDFLEIKVADSKQEAKAIRITINNVLFLNGKKKITKVEAITKNGEVVNLIFFSHSKLFYKGTKITVYKKEGLNEPTISHPEWVLGHHEFFSKMGYPVEGIPPAILNQVTLKCVECLPESLVALKNNLRLVHQKCDSNAILELARMEALVYQASMEMAMRQKLNDVDCSFTREPLENALVNFKSKLTDCQERVWNEIKNDLFNKSKMVRILYGDVGSGKTMIAALALNLCYQNGFQGALLAPTEILARQHFNFFKELFPEIPIVLLTGTNKTKKILSYIKEETCIIIGTHALIQESVEYKSLRLFIIDEQHRFGVLQRLKAANHHTLLMTATPIPRTLQLATVGAVPISKILKRPQGHRDLRVYTKYNKKIDEVIERIAKIIESGDSVFWVCPFIQESPNGMNVIKRCALLDESFPGLVGMLHGNMSNTSKEEVLNKFYNKEIRILVATTIIEVGVNIPHANMIVIENSELFGIAQLYQLMGRVGRGDRHGECFFVYEKLTTDARLRLQALKNCSSGIELAEQDLYIRGFGELLGTQQSGKGLFRCVSSKDYHLLESAYAEVIQNAGNQDFDDYIRDLQVVFNYLESPWQGA